MTTVRRNGPTAEKFKLTIAERVTVVGLIALAMMGVFILLVAVGMNR
jgi:hypothetical protein